MKLPLFIIVYFLPIVIFSEEDPSNIFIKKLEVSINEEFPDDSINDHQKNLPGKRIDFLTVQLNLSPKNEISTLQGYFKAHHDLTSFQKEVLQSLIVKDIKDNDCIDLEAILENNLPNRIGITPIELFLVMINDYKKTIDLLYMVYTKSVAPVKPRLLNIFANAFPNLAKNYDLPRQADIFMEKCQSYVNLNYGHLIINSEYGDAPIPIDLFTYDKNPTAKFK